MKRDLKRARLFLDDVFLVVVVGVDEEAVVVPSRLL